MANTVEVDGVSITSSDETVEQIQSAFAPQEGSTAEAVEPESLAGTAEDSPAAEGGEKPAEPQTPKVDKRTREGRKQSIEQEISTHLERKRLAKEDADAEEARLVKVKAEAVALESRRSAALDTTRAEQPRESAPSDGDPEPDPKTYPGEEYDPKYLKDVARWEGRAAARDFHAKQQEVWTQQQQMRAATERDRTWGERLDAARVKDPDYDSKIVADLPINAPTRDLIKTSENGPAILLYLNEHQDLARRLATLPPGDTFREIGKIEARLEAASTPGPAPKPPVISHAKPLIKPVSASQSVNDDDTDDDEDLSEAALLRHIKRENASDPRINPRAARR